MWKIVTGDPRRTPELLRKQEPIGRKNGWTFYEDPIYGEDEPLLALRNQELYRTDMFEME